MRIILILIFILKGFTGDTQVIIDSINGRIYIDRVQEIGLNKDQLKEKANRWVAKTYNNSNYVTRINNDDNILTKGIFTVGANFRSYGMVIYSERNIEYTLDLKFKDGRYKIEISDLQFKGLFESTPLSTYFMSADEYREYSRRTMASYVGAGKKMMLKRIDDDRKFKRDYDAQHDYGKKIIPQIVQNLKSIDLSLLTFLMDNDDKDDW